MLLKAGIAYPVGDASAPHQQGGFLVPPLWDGFRPDFETLLNNWVGTEYNGKNCTRLVLSAEGLSNAPAGRTAELLQRLSQYGRVHVIYTIRNWADYLPSRYQQNIKVGDNWTWADFLKNCKADFKTHADINFGLVLDAYKSPYTTALTVLDYKRQTILSDLYKTMSLKANLISDDQDFNSSRDSVHIETARLLNAVYHNTHNLPSNLRYDSLHTRTRQSNKINFMKSAYTFLTQNPKADALRSALTTSTKTEDVLSAQDISDWTESVQTTLIKIGSPLDISHWKTALPAGFHTAPTLTWPGLSQDLKSALLKQIEN